jgi:nicotinate-nucleotide adenylyltransferase
MCRLAAASLASFEVSDVEVTRADPSYTVLTLRYLAQTMGPGEELFLLAGADNLPLLHTWRHFEEIMHLARVAILPRGGDGAEADLTALRCAIGDRATEEILGRRVVCPLVPVSATEVRERLRAGQDVGGLLPSSVAAYIRAVSLYLP